MSLEADLVGHRIEGIARHGMVDFSVPLISHIAGSLYVGGCIDGVPLPSEIRHVVSMYQGERYRLHSGVASHLNVSMNDVADEPDGALVWALAAHVDRMCSLGPTLVHCQAGLNRSNLIAGAALILHGYGREDAVRLLRERRSPAVLCNKTFESWLLREGL